MQMVRLVIITLLILSTPFAVQADSLKLGVFPYLSADKILRTHQPVAQYLTEQLGQKVELISAPDFPLFIRRTRQNKFDMVITAPHMGALAILQSDYQRLAVSSNKSQAVFVALKSSPYSDLSDSQQATFTLPPQKAIITKLAHQTLTDQDINLETLDIQYTQSHNNAMEAVLNRESDIAAFGLPTWKRSQQPDREKLKVLARSDDIPGFMALANKSLNTEKVQHIAQLLQDFHQTSSGNNYFKQSKLQSFRAIQDSDIENLAPFVESIFKFTRP